jgi:hypothetical protein
MCVCVCVCCFLAQHALNSSRGHGCGLYKSSTTILAIVVANFECT